MPVRNQNLPSSSSSSSSTTWYSRSSHPPPPRPPPPSSSTPSKLPMKKIIPPKPSSSSSSSSSNFGKKTQTIKEEEEEDNNKNNNNNSKLQKRKKFERNNSDIEIRPKKIILRLPLSLSPLSRSPGSDRPLTPRRPSSLRPPMTRPPPPTPLHPSRVAPAPPIIRKREREGGRGRERSHVDGRKLEERFGGKPYGGREKGLETQTDRHKGRETEVEGNKEVRSKVEEKLDTNRNKHGGEEEEEEEKEREKEEVEEKHEKRKILEESREKHEREKEEKEEKMIMEEEEEEEKEEEEEDETDSSPIFPPKTVDKMEEKKKEEEEEEERERKEEETMMETKRRRRLKEEEEEDREKRTKRKIESEKTRKGGGGGGGGELKKTQFLIASGSTASGGGVSRASRDSRGLSSSSTPAPPAPPPRSSSSSSTATTTAAADKKRGDTTTTTATAPRRPRLDNIKATLNAKPARISQRKPADPVKAPRSLNTGLGAPRTGGHNGPAHTPSPLQDHVKRLEAEAAARAAEVKLAREEKEEVTRAVEALTVLLHHLANTYDPFSTPRLKADVRRLNSQLTETRLSLDESSAALKRLQEREASTAEQHSKEVQALAAQHQHALDLLAAQHKLDLDLALEKHRKELSKFAEDQQTQREEVSRAHTAEVEQLDGEWRAKLDVQHEKHLCALQELNTRHMHQLRELETTRRARERELEEANYRLQGEQEALKVQSKKLEETLLNDTDHRLVAVRKMCASLKSEVESLKSVVEMKNSEIHGLRSQVVEVDRLTSDLELARERAKSLQAKTEDLQAQMEKKSQQERSLVNEHRLLVETCQRESNVNKRLSLENEELAWKLRQREELIMSISAPPPSTSSHSSLDMSSRSSTSSTPRSATPQATPRSPSPAMRNLAVVDHRRRAIPAVARDAVLCVDPISLAPYIATTAGVQCLDQAPPSWPAITWDQHDVSTTRVVSAECVAAAAALCVVTAEGQVVTVAEDGQVEIAGDVSDGIAAAQWSPDQELLALVTPSDLVLLMTASFDPIAETKLGDGAGHEMVALGWGKKETQFHGSEGKMAAQVTKTAIRPAPEWDDGRPRVTWRGDGEHFAISHLPIGTNVRKIIVLNRECVIQSISEDLDALESPLAWKPSGSLIASTQTSATKHEVAFVEKNGLKHGGFALPFAPGCMEVVELSWSADSSVLAVWVRPLVDGKEEVVQLWTSGNYHWYLKRELRFGGRGRGGGGGKEGKKDENEGGEEGKESFSRGEDESGRGGGESTVENEEQTKEQDIINIRWTEETTSPLLTLHILTTTHHHRLTLLHTTHHTQGHSPQDPASVAVIDGHKVLMTPFRHVTIPPPMSAYEVEFPDPVNSIAFCLLDSSVDGDVDDSGYLEGCEDVGVECTALCVQHGVDKITFLAASGSDEVVDGHGCAVRLTGAGGQGFRASVRPLGVCGQCEVQWPVAVSPRPGSAREVYHWAWPRTDLLVAVFGADDGCFLVFIEVQAMTQAVARDVLPLEDFVVAMAASPTLAALQLASGSLVKLDLATRSLEPWLVDGTEVQLPATLQQLCLCPVEGAAGPTPLGLTPRGRLYLGHRQLLAGCTSVLLHTHHLLATTSAHTLLAVPLTTQALASMEEASGGAGVRRVERGARLVCGVGHDTRVVMQMPRGNLEVVSPRPLALHALGRLLAARQYRAALTLALRHRVDTNLLYDHQPHHFLAAADHFVRDVADPQRLDVFLAALTDADCTTTTYAFQYPGRPATAPGKVAAVCEAVRAAMVAVDEGRLLLPILTSLVRGGRMEDALARLGDMRRQAEAGQAFPVGPEEGLRHLLYLADTDELYRVALGTYDLSLALMVAQRSTRDPKEYLPQLNDLAALPQSLREFRIDATLRRFTTALRSVDDAALHRDEALALVDTHGLHTLALQLLPAGSQVKAAVCESYGRRLLADNKPAEAAIMLGRAGLHQEALQAYRSAGNWQMALVMAARLGLAKERVGELCRELAGELRSQGRHTDAARLYEHHLADEEEAVACLTTAGEWQDALRLAHQHGRPDLLQTHVQPGACQQAAATLADTQDTAAAITRQVARLAVVRTAQQRQHAASLALAAEDAPLDSDLYSDTSTVTGLDQSGRRGASTATSSTAASSRSHRSSKSRRKLERKKYSTKEGSPQEDLGLVAALHEAYSSLARRAEATSALCAALVTLGHDTEAAELQCAFANLLKLAEGKKAEIWPAAAPQEQEFGPQMTTQAAVERVLGGAGQDQADGSLVALRMAQLEPHLRFPPPPVREGWQLALLAWQDKAA